MSVSLCTYIKMDKKKQQREFGKTYPLVLGPALAIDNVPAPPIEDHNAKRLIY